MNPSTTLSAFHFMSKHAPIKKKSQTEIFQEKEQLYAEPALEILVEVKILIEDKQTKWAIVRLEKQCPLPVYEFILETVDPPNKVRNCLNALSRWVFRVLEYNPNSTIQSNVKQLEKAMNEKCKFCG